MSRLSWFAACLLALVWSLPAVGADDTTFFEQRIRPLLVQRCEGCHSSQKGKTQGGLALDSRKGWQTGGETGPAIVPGQPAESLLIKAIGYADDSLQMPPESAGGKLSAAEIALLTEWVAKGAFDPREPKTGRGGLTEQQLRDWWSFQPVRPIVVPESPPAAPAEHPIDRFLNRDLVAAGLLPAPPASRQELIRRITYDLTGLPPTPDEVRAFVNDASPQAYAQLIDRLLGSARYGERWGRHWLDVVRYADTAGENSDHPIPDAWRYRNWVIDALNRDLPYDQFVRDQIAGDLIHADAPPDQYAAGVVATGFLALARRFDHDSDKWMHLTIEDTIDTVGKAFLGLSVACARCHDHKYDPISARDYYALYGIFSSTRYAFPGCEAKQQPRDLVPLLPPAEWARTIEPFDRALAALDASLKEIDTALAGQAKAFSEAVGDRVTKLAAGKIADGGSQKLSEGQEPRLEVPVTPGQLLVLTIDPDGNYGADTTVVEWDLVEQGGENRRWNLAQDITGDFLQANPHADGQGHPGVWLFLDTRGGLGLLPDRAAKLDGQPALSAWRKGDNPSVFVNSSADPVKVWTTLPGKTVFVHPAPDGAVAIGWVSPIAGTVKIEGRVADGHPGGPNGVGWKLEQLTGDLTTVLAEMSRLGTRRAGLAAERAALAAQAPRKETAYAVVEGPPAHARLHLRGDPEKPGEEVPRRWLELFGGEPLPANAGSGRRELANWLSDARNPLVARVMVNRVWQYHFGTGLVPTPNDFGTRGQVPTHPELLDWLAQQLVDSGWSLKALHRLILQSAAYQRSSRQPDTALLEGALARDPNNALYWRFNRLRLDAEQLRDSLLMAAGQLDLSPGGALPIPPAAGWSYSQHVPFAGVPESNQRTIYQIVLRNRRPPFMALFDGADPNATTPLRQVTTVPTQSLYFLNDPFFHAQAEALARRVLPAATDEARVRQLYELALQRDATAAEVAAALGFTAEYTAAVAEPAEPAQPERPLAVWSALTRIVLAGNEFLYVD